MTQLITPFLWFDGQAELAAELYVSLFRDARIGVTSRYGKEGFEHHGQPEGRAMVVEIELAGYRLNLLNGGPMFKLTPAISLFVQLETEEEVNALWAGLSEGGAVMMPLSAYPWSKRYGWLNDRFGVSWQIAVGSRADIRQTITPSLLFVGPQAGKAEAALKLYTATFPNSSVEGILRHDGSGADAAGTVQHAQFYLSGETFMAMDSAGPHEFGFTEAVSFMISCKTQAEIDHYWHALIADGGSESMCGWLKDRFGVSWQVVPSRLGEMMSGPDREAASRVMRAFLAMRKFDIAALEAAFRG
jgi:predicted 3-demethylubiquinone-9 3-methyltransferase (glyoxalase superfamily)